MVVEHSRDHTRQFFLTAWRKHQEQIPLEPLETLVCAVILAHPEYHASLQPEQVDKDYLEVGKTNPFLHMGLHIALREQVSIDRPLGIQAVYQKGIKQRGDSHAVEHLMMDCLAQALWSAQQNHTLPDEQAYLDCLRHCILKLA